MSSTKSQRRRARSYPAVTREHMCSCRIGCCEHTATIYYCYKISLAQRKSVKTRLIAGPIVYREKRLEPR